MGEYRKISLREREAMTTRIIDGLENGRTLLEICTAEDINDATLRKWRLKDDNLDQRIFTARLKGIWPKLDAAEKGLNEARTRDEILKSDKVASHCRWMAEKLLTTFQPDRKINIEHSGPVIIGWRSRDNDDDAKVIDHDPAEVVGQVARAVL